MHVRTATSDDVAAIAAMASDFRKHLQRLLPTDAQLLTSVGTLIGATDAEFFLAIEDDMPVGYVLQRYRYSMWGSGTEATIEDLFVAPRGRGKRLGTQLIEFALRMAKARSCTSVCLDTNENNAASTRIYTRLGFDSMSKRWGARQLFFRLNLRQAVADAVVAPE